MSNIFDIEFTHKETRVCKIDLDKFCTWLKEKYPTMKNFTDENTTAIVLSAYTDFKLPIDEVREIAKKLFTEDNINYIKAKL